MFRVHSIIRPLRLLVRVLSIQCSSGIAAWFVSTLNKGNEILLSCYNSRPNLTSLVVQAMPSEPGSEVVALTRLEPGAKCQ